MAPNRSDGLETRNKLLAAAAAHFAAKGFDKATTTGICHAAGANIAAVHYHFRSKEQLYAEAWRHAFERSFQAHPPDGGVPESAPAADRLHGQIRAIVRRMLDPVSLDLDIAHKEMASPTGLLAEVMRRSIEPLRREFSRLVRELLGPHATEQEVYLCADSIHAQCFAPLAHERQHRAAKLTGVPGPPVVNVGAETRVEHIFRFSLAGIHAVRKSAGSRHLASRRGGSL
jgi:AcrR family transcriptional regulator